MKKLKTALCTVLALCFIAAIAYSGYRIWLIQADYGEEARMHDAIMDYRPEPQPEQGNQKIIDLQAQYPDAVGWLTVPNTNIDYPFVQYTDNGYYLRRDMNGSHAAAGTLFMDCRCDKAFLSRNTILYGHHMKNGSMFGTLKSFGEKDFFEANRYGTVYLPGKTLTLEFFAYIIVDPSTESEIYNIDLSGGYFAYTKQSAKQYRDMDFTPEDRIVTLSTCAYEFDNARMVLLGKIT